MLRWSKDNAEQSPLRLLLWTALAGLIFGLIGFGEIAEDGLRAWRNKLHPHAASREIALIKIDDASLRQFGNWPWPRRRHAELLDRLTERRANRVFFDVSFAYKANPADDRLLADALERSGRTTLAVRARSGAGQGARQDSAPAAPFSAHAEQATISVPYNYVNAAWLLPYGSDINGRFMPSLAAKLARGKQPTDGTFRVDYSTDPATFATYSAAEVLEGKVPANAFAGKDVLIGATSDVIGDIYMIPGYGKMGGMYVHAIGAETLKRGQPIDGGWLPPFLLTLIAAALATTRRHGTAQGVVLGGVALALLGLPALLESRLIFLDITPALFVVAIVGGAAAYRRLRGRALVNALSGLPNLGALRANREGRSQALIGVRVLNYAEIVATMPADRERQLVEQIVARLQVGASERTLYHGDGGIFAWFESPGQPVGHHLEALYALFRNPARIGDLTVDLAVAFGVEIGSSRSLNNRLASALVAAEEAAHAGLKWMYHDPETLTDASWKLSILSQLDAAVDKGEVWVAYQPKLDIPSRQIVGAEALARWTHPEKGPIAASEFVAAAEQHDRIAKLTDFVLEQAIAAGAAINLRHPGFSVSANLSARLLNDQGFVLRLTAMLARHRLPAKLLTLELTETAALAGNGGGFEMLAALREMGVTISIDDYGTGLSTLEYLKKIPATEIKIDQSFVKGMLDNRSDRLMVQSTIGLAHALGRTVVAEGVERRDTLEALIEMGCDIAQGYVIGRPMSLDSLVKRIGSARKAAVA